MAVMMKLMMDIAVRIEHLGMTGLDVLGESSNCQFFFAHHRDGVIFHPFVLCNEGCYGLHDDDNWTGMIFGMDPSAIAAAQTEGGIKSKVSKENESQKENEIQKNV